MTSTNPVSQDDAVRVAKLIFDELGRDFNFPQLERSLNSIKRGIDVRSIDFNHIEQRDLWESILKRSNELKRLLQRANRQPIHSLVFGTRGLEDDIEQLTQLHDRARPRLKYFDDLTKGRRAGRSPAQEFAYQSLVELWAKYGGVPAKGKTGPFYRFLTVSCAALHLKIPSAENIRNIVDRHHSVS